MKENYLKAFVNKLAKEAKKPTPPNSPDITMFQQEGSNYKIITLSYQEPSSLPSNESFKREITFNIETRMHRLQKLINKVFGPFNLPPQIVNINMINNFGEQDGSEMVRKAAGWLNQRKNARNHPATS